MGSPTTLEQQLSIRLQLLRGAVYLWMNWHTVEMKSAHKDFAILFAQLKKHWTIIFSPRYRRDSSG
jgi:hypothetical protein